MKDTCSSHRAIHTVYMLDSVPVLLQSVYPTAHRAVMNVSDNNTLRGNNS